MNLKYITNKFTPSGDFLHLFAELPKTVDINDRAAVLKHAAEQRELGDKADRTGQLYGLFTAPVSLSLPATIHTREGVQESAAKADFELFELDAAGAPVAHVSADGTIRMSRKLAEVVFVDPVIEDRVSKDGLATYKRIVAQGAVHAYIGQSPLPGAVMGKARMTLKLPTTGAVPAAAPIPKANE